MLADGVDERLRQLLAGGVAVGVEDAGEAVAALARERQAVGLGRRPCRSWRPSESSSSTRSGPSLTTISTAVVVAQARPALLGVLDVRLVAVQRLEHRRDAALGVPGVGLVDGVLGEDEDVRPLLRRRDGRPQPRDAAADDQHVGELLGEPGGFERDEVAALREGLEHCEGDSNPAPPRLTAASGAPAARPGVRPGARPCRAPTAPCTVSLMCGAMFGSLTIRIISICISPISRSSSFPCFSCIRFSADADALPILSALALSSSTSFFSACIFGFASFADCSSVMPFTTSTISRIFATIWSATASWPDLESQPATAASRKSTHREDANRIGSLSEEGVLERAGSVAVYPLPGCGIAISRADHRSRRQRVADGVTRGPVLLVVQLDQVDR